MTYPSGQIATIHRRYTISDVARIANVRPARIRRWLQLKLLEPAGSTQRPHYFNFHQVAFAKQLSELVARGTPLTAIRQGFAQLRRWLPEEKLPICQITRLEQDGRVLVRLNNRLVDGSRQRHFDFAEDYAVTLAPCFDTQGLDTQANLDDLFEAALDAEDAGRLDEAAEAYRRCLALDPAEPSLHFNLGNVLFGLQRWKDSARSYCAALRFDPQYAEAWNNLGNAYAELQKYGRAAHSFRRALQLVPDYALAQTNLNEVLQKSRMEMTKDQFSMTNCEIASISVPFRH